MDEYQSTRTRMQSELDAARAMSSTEVARLKQSMGSGLESAQAELEQLRATAEDEREQFAGEVFF